jgi:hypothetical protein
MRAHEFLCEQSHEDLARDALITLITTQHAMGIPTIKTSQLLKSLEDRNFFMDQDWVWSQMHTIPVVDMQQSKPEQIVLKLSSSEPEATPPKQPTEPNNAKTVEKMAKNALAQRIK